MPCENARSLVPSYLDGELSEEQAAPLREHLYACRDCREQTKQEKSLKAWFVDEEVAIPAGFAGEIARRAFAGEGARVAEPTAFDETADDAAPRRERAGTLLPFVLKLSTLAAGVLFTFAVGIQQKSLPTGDGLDATEYTPPWEKELPAERARSGAPESVETVQGDDDEELETPGESR